jgi:hypothetical protein
MIRLLQILALLMLTDYARANCLSPISRQNVGPGQKPPSVAFDGDMNLAYGRLNDLPGDCLSSLSVGTAEITNDSIESNKIAASTIQASKFASGLVPIFRKPIRVRAYTAVGASTWIKGSDVGAVFVQVVGGGGSGASDTSGTIVNSTPSSFGSLCTANGGLNSNDAQGSGATASGGDLNISGGTGTSQTVILSCYSWGGFTQPCRFPYDAGISMLGPYGRGGRGNGTRGGGAGGYCARYIQEPSLPSSVTVTVGSRANISSATHLNWFYSLPGHGLVIIYEFGK